MSPEIKISPVQISRLRTMYDSVMKSTAEKDLQLITKAANDTKLEVLHVKVCGE